MKMVTKKNAVGQTLSGPVATNLVARNERRKRSKYLPSGKENLNIKNWRETERKT